MNRRKYLKQVMAVATAISMVLPQTVAYAEDVSAQQSNVVQVLQEQNLPVNTYDDDFLRSLGTPATGYREVEDSNIQAPGIVNGDVSTAWEVSNDKATVYPAKYKTANLPAVRNQNPYGVCWAFSTISLLEINLIKKGLVNSNIDLSEMHLINFTYDCQLDPLGGNEGDENSFKTSQGDVTELGGNVEMAVNSLMDWEGAVDESVLPYTSDNAYKINHRDIDSSLAYSNTKAHLESYYKINTSSRNDIKQAVTDYGAVSISYYADTSFASSNYYNSQESAYYCYDDIQHNHAVTIVGWDDDFSADNFPTKPEGNGAWIVRNSWGEGYGEGGYFYLSYYDASIAETGYAFEAGLSNNYDNNYQYDGALWYQNFLFQSQTNTYANVFTAKANEGNKESIEAVSFETYQAANASYKVQIYKNLSDMSRPQSGTLVSEKSGKLTFEGAYTIKLDKAVEVDEGDTFSVVVELTGATENQYPYVIFDTNCGENDNRYWYISKSSAKENQSFMKYPGEDYWEDCGEKYNVNVRIKAYTNNQAKETVNVESISLDKTSATLNKKGETVQLNAVIAPANADNQNVTFTSSNEAVAKVDNKGLVTAVSAGTAVITVTTQDGSKTAKCTITVKEEETTKATESTTEATTKATESTTKATEATTKATESTTKATEATTKATESTTKATEATTKATESTTKATEATTKATESTTKATEATTKATEATTKATEATTKATESTTKATESTTKATEATTKATEATTKATQATTKATTKATEATTKATEATTEITQPEHTTPSTEVTKPNDTINSLINVDGNWYYYVDGQIDTNYNGLAQNEYGWWKITNGTVDFGYNGMALNEYGWWKVTNGAVDLGYTGMALNDYGWWYITNGALDLNYTGMALNDYGWWYITNGALDLGYTGMALNDYGWWYMTNGALDLGYTGMALNDYGWWYMTNGALDLGYTGMALNDYGWWYMTNGTLDWNYKGLALNPYGWWYINNGTVDFSYTGYADNQYGTWNVVNGMVVI